MNTPDPFENWPTYQEWLESGGPEQAEQQLLADPNRPQEGMETARCPNCQQKMTKKVGSGPFRCKSCRKQARKAS